MTRFSRRIGPGQTNALTQLLLARRAAGAPVLDLTVSNPTAAELPYPADLLAALADPAALRYAPEPRGLGAARAAVARALAARGAAVDPADLILTASTSEAYSFLFKLLCDPGDEVLAPEPSYPLFSYLCELEGVVRVPYHLAYDGAWHVDAATVAEALTLRTRAILAVSPNHPTGSYLTEDELARLAAHGLPLVVDEVFADYPLDDRAGDGRVLHAARGGAEVLTFSLGGLSKCAGLPQLKLGWIVAAGPGKAEALLRLELIADSYLSVGTPVQVAAARLLEAGVGIRAAIQTRIRRNRAALAALVPPWITLLPAEAGWSAILRFPATRTDEELALALLDEHGVLVQPGYFFDLPRGTFLVVSLLTPPATLQAGLAAILRA